MNIEKSDAINPTHAGDEIKSEDEDEEVYETTDQIFMRHIINITT